MASRPGPWLDRFSEPCMIRRRGLLDHVACRDLATGEGRVVIATAEPSLGGLLDRIAHVHRELRHPNIPVLDQRGSASGTEFVALCSGAVVDADTLIPVAMTSGGFSPAASAAFLYTVVAAIQAGHATRDPRTDAPLCIGAFSGVNVLISEASHVDVIGWGYPTTETERRAVLRDPTAMHLAWEASFHAPPTPKSDLDAVGRFFHALLPATAMPPELIAALRGDAGERKTAELVRLIGRLEDSAHARDPDRRSWQDYVESVRRITALLGVVPDDDELQRELARVCGLWRAGSQLRVARDGSRVTLRSGERIEIDRRPSLRGIVAALAACRRDRPGEVLDAEALVAAGWPGERVSEDSGRNRLRVAISTLRSMGLRDVLLSRGDGYLFDPDVPIQLE